jgi:hypothetical protein
MESWGGVHYLCSLVPRGLLETSSVPATSRCQYGVTHLVGATRLVDEISQGTGIRSKPGFRSFGAWHASRASDRRDVSRKPILIMRVSRDPSTCTSWSWTQWSCWRPGSPNLTRPSQAGLFPCPGLARDRWIPKVLLHSTETGYSVCMVSL